MQKFSAHSLLTHFILWQGLCDASTTQNNSFVKIWEQKHLTIQRHKRGAYPAR